MIMKEVYRRVARWNAARYDRELNLVLAESLLLEELRETHEAIDEVQRLDGLCDLTYVALGVIWKSGYEEHDEDEIVLALNIAHSMVNVGFRPIDAIASVISAFRRDNEMPAVLAMHVIVILATIEMVKMRLTQDQAEAAMLVVCNSNDTKIVQKVSSDKKANDGNKGPGFIDPAPALQAILNQREGVNNVH